MRNYTTHISLQKNGRGIWDLDTVKGCYYGIKKNKNGCYSECYANKIAKRYNIDFSNSVLRSFKNKNHIQQIIKQINKSNVEFIRIGCSGDPSFNWDHTIKIIRQIRNVSQLKLFDYNEKLIVIITRHWNILTDNQLLELSKLNVCINTSVSSIDSKNEIKKQLHQYNRIKKYTKSILRVITFDFNIQSKNGLYFNNIQNELLKNENIIETAFRPSKNNRLLSMNIIKTMKMEFNTASQFISNRNSIVYTGNCFNCIEKCGLNI